MIKKRALFAREKLNWSRNSGINQINPLHFHYRGAQVHGICLPVESDKLKSMKLSSINPNRAYEEEALTFIKTL